MSDLETETTGGDTTTFPMFGRDWTIPAKRHHSHVREMKRIIRAEGGLDADDIATIFLPVEEYEALVALDVDEPALSEFASTLSKALGLGDSGNSEPSATSS